MRALRNVHQSLLSLCPPIAPQRRCVHLAVPRCLLRVRNVPTVDLRLCCTNETISGWKRRCERSLRRTAGCGLVWWWLFCTVPFAAYPFVSHWPQLLHALHTVVRQRDGRGENVAWWLPRAPSSTTEVVRAALAN